jgi:outer membrane lipase/esterase
MQKHFTGEVCREGTSRKLGQSGDGLLGLDRYPPRRQPTRNAEHIWRHCRSGGSAVLLTVVSLMLLATGQSSADELINGDLNGTSLQINTGIGIQTACGGFLANPDETRTNLEQALFTRCGEMVHTFRSLRGQDNANPDLVLASITTEDELADALQEIAGEETLAPRSMATEAARGQFASVAARLAAIRGGATGFTISGLPVSPADRTGYATVLDLPADLPARGGAASADEPALNKNLGGFVNLVGTTGDRDATDLEDGFDFDGFGGTIGLDYRLTSNFIVGAALGYNVLRTDFNKSAAVAGGSVDANNYSVSLYATESIHDLYIDGIVTYGRTNYDIKRRILYDVQNRTAKADTDSDQYSVAVGVGYEAHKEALSFGPQFRLSYLKLSVDGYEESGAQELNLAVDDQNVESVQSALGGQIAYTISGETAVFRPYATAEWRREFQDHVRVISTQYVNDPRNNILSLETNRADRNYYVVGAGISTVFPGGTQASFSYDTILDLDKITSHTFTLAARLEF